MFISFLCHISLSSYVVFVADLFLEDYVGGAELTTEALINWGLAPRIVKNFIIFNLSLFYLAISKKLTTVLAILSMVSLFIYGDKGKLKTSFDNLSDIDNPEETDG